jgi:hypothetical protein
MNNLQETRIYGEYVSVNVPDYHNGTVDTYVIIIVTANTIKTTEGRKAL